MAYPFNYNKKFSKYLLSHFDDDKAMLLHETYSCPGIELAWRNLHLVVLLPCGTPVNIEDHELNVELIFVPCFLLER